jgi:hypothetical protein
MEALIYVAGLVVAAVGALAWLDGADKGKR